MPNFTTPVPPKLSGNTASDVTALKNWGTALIDELTYIFNHLDASNVTEALSVKAENIDTTNAKIKNAQIDLLSADKLQTGELNTDKVTVTDKNGNLTVSGSEIVISDRSRERFVASFDNDQNQFRFILFNEDGTPTVTIDSDGDAIFSGIMESARVYSSTIVGTDRQSFLDTNGGVFANIDPKGIKVMQDKNGRRYQKIGMSVANDGTAYFVLGSGNGNGSTNINGVTYTDGTFKIEKNESCANMGLVGYAPFITFWESSGELWLSGSNVLINGINLSDRITQIENNISTINQRIQSIENRLSAI